MAKKDPVSKVPAGAAKDHPDMVAPADFLGAVSQGLPGCRPFRTRFAGFSVPEMVPHLVMHAIDPELFKVVLGADEAERWMATVDSAYELLRQDFSGVFVDVDRTWQAQRQWWRRFVRKGAGGKLVVLDNPPVAQSAAGAGSSAPAPTGEVPTQTPVGGRELVERRLSGVRPVQRGQAPDPSSADFIQTPHNDADLVLAAQAAESRPRKKGASSMGTGVGPVVRPASRPPLSQADSYSSEASVDSEELHPEPPHNALQDGSLRGGKSAVELLRLVFGKSVDAGGDYARKWVETGGSSEHDWHDWGIDSADLDVLDRERSRSGLQR